MSDTARALRSKLAAARSATVVAFGDITLQQAEADRAVAIAELEAQLLQRESEEAGSWLGQHGDGTR